MTDEQIIEFYNQFAAGEAHHAENVLGAHLTKEGAVFRVWAPRASQVCLSGEFNGWSLDATHMDHRYGGIWEVTIPGMKEAGSYKYVITAYDGRVSWKADPYGFYTELRPASASLVWDVDKYKWGDAKWLAHRRTHKVYESPVNIYEVHLGSWARNDDGTFLTYRQAAERLIPYVKDMGFTHVEFMPLTEYPYDASWGYQCTGYFAATSRYGTPEDLMFLIDSFHQAGIGVIMDWVPAHFPKDPQGLVEFNGYRLYENDDPQMAEHPSWGTRIFDYGKGEVRSFLISSARFWLEKYHVDGLRVDAVASMLYLDYDRQGGYWTPNEYGGNGNLKAVEFLKALNSSCFSYDDSVLMIAEESTAWPMVSRPVSDGGLGFNLKWNMGWMNDTQRYLKTDPFFRSHHHNDLTFSIMYAFSENFVLPLSHDEVVHMKGALATKAPGEREQRFATVRVFWSYMLAHPGKNLVFMGAELGQETEWKFDDSLPWDMLQYADHKALQDFFKEANEFYKTNKPLWADDFRGEGFQWICPDARDNNILAFIRKDGNGKQTFFLCSFSGGENREFRLGVPSAGTYAISFSTDEERFGGTGALKEGKSFKAEKVPFHGMDYSIVMDVPPLTAVFFKKTRAAAPGAKATEAKAVRAKSASKAAAAKTAAAKTAAKAKAAPRTSAKTGTGAKTRAKKSGASES